MCWWHPARSLPLSAICNYIIPSFSSRILKLTFSHIPIHKISPLSAISKGTNNHSFHSQSELTIQTRFTTQLMTFVNSRLFPLTNLPSWAIHNFVNTKSPDFEIEKSGGRIVRGENERTEGFSQWSALTMSKHKVSRFWNWNVEIKLLVWGENERIEGFSWWWSAQQASTMLEEKCKNYQHTKSLNSKSLKVWWPD